jgi:hypothetical protein
MNEMNDYTPPPESVFNWIKGRDLKLIRHKFGWPDEDIAELDSMCKCFKEKN